MKASIWRCRFLLGEVLSTGSAVKETLAGRRKPLRETVARLVGPAGWQKVRANVFERIEDTGIVPTEAKR
jgi:hypothetical protein